MTYTFRFFTEEDFYPIEALVLSAYQWEVPLYGLSRHEFSKGLHPAFVECANSWRHTVGIFEENGEIASCVISEGNYEGDAFFVFDSQARAQDGELLARMFAHAETHLSAWDAEARTRNLHLRIPKWNTVMRDMAASRGYASEGSTEKVYILPFPQEPFEVSLPEGYTLADGNTTPDFFLSNVHMFSFLYGKPAAETGEQAFHDLRQMKHYRPELDLCVLDPDGKPVGMAIIWYDGRMPYAELEPLGVVWWERRKGIATALIHEAANRVRKLGNCRGMTGGDQQFYFDLGFKLEGEADILNWSKRIRQSWE